MTVTATHHPFLECLTRAQRPILVLGDVMLDRFVYGQVGRMSPEAPVPVLSLEREQAMMGGAANVARNIAALGGRSVLIGVIGQDAAGQTLGALARADKGVEPRLISDPTRPTTEKTRFVSGRQQLLRLDSEKIHPLSDAALRAVIGAFEEALPQAGMVLLSDYAKGVLTDAVLAHVIARAERAGLPVFADPKSADFARYRGVALLTPNRHELARAAGQSCEDADSVVRAGSALMARHGFSAMLVTRGEQGMTLLRAGAAPLHLAAEAREVFDVSGAGDTVMATLALSQVGGLTLDDAARFANLAAGIVVGKSGTATVLAEDIQSALQTTGQLSGADKVMTRAEVAARAQHWRAGGHAVGFTNGCFDLLHPGHLRLLERARAACDRLIVGLNSDASVRRLKGPSRPVQVETNRALMLAALGMVDAVVVFEEDTPQALIESLRPDVLVKGADYRIDQVVGADFVQSYGGRVVLVDLVEGQSTSGLIARSNPSEKAAS